MKTCANRNTVYTVIIIMALVVVLTILLLKDVSLLDSFMSLGKWGTKGADSSERTIIWGDYLSKAGESIRYAMFGAPLLTIPSIAIHGGNCHNSFLQLHANNGLLTFIVFIVLLFRSFLYYWRSKQYIMLSMLTVLVIRGMTDKFIFGQYGMPIMLFFVLHPMIDRQRMVDVTNLINVLLEKLKDKPMVVINSSVIKRQKTRTTPINSDFGSSMNKAKQHVTKAKSLSEVHYVCTDDADHARGGMAPISRCGSETVDSG